MAVRLRSVCLLMVAAATLSTARCSSRAEDRDDARQVPGAVAVRAKPAAQGDRRIVVLGDSLTAGLGLAVRDAYPSVLQERLNTQGLNFEVVNAGVSGDTSAG